MLRAYFYFRIFLNAFPLKRKDIKTLLSQFKDIKFKNNRVILYRAIRLKADDSPLIECVGRYWTINKIKAFPYGGKGTREYYYIYHAIVPFKSINWKLTIKHSLWEHRHEKEVALLFGRDIEVNKIEKIKDLKPYRLEGGGWKFPREVEETITIHKCKV